MIMINIMNIFVLVILELLFNIKLTFVIKINIIIIENKINLYKYKALFLYVSRNKKYIINVNNLVYLILKNQIFFH